MASSSPPRKASTRRSQLRSMRLDQPTRRTVSDLSVTRLEYTMMSEGNSPSGSREHLSVRQVSPPDSMNRKVFMVKLQSLSKLHVDEAIGTDDRHPQLLTPKIAFSMDASLADTLDETDVSEASPRTDSPQAASVAALPPVEAPAAKETASRILPTAKYLLDLFQETFNMECVGSSCNALQLKCEEVSDDLEDLDDAPRSSPFPSTSNFSQSYRSTDDEYGDFDSFYSTFDETTHDQDTYLTGPLQLRDQADIAKVSRFDDTTTLSSQNSGWL